MRGSTVLIVASLLALGGALVYESLRERPEPAPPVVSRAPLLEDETSRLEGGFSWTLLDGSRPVLQLEASSMVALEGGAHFLQEVAELMLYTDDGRPVRVQSERGTLRETGTRGDQVEARLVGRVRVRDPAGMLLETHLLSYDSEARLLSSPGPARIEGEGLRALLSRFDYRPDTRVVETSGPLELELGLGPPWRIDARRALYRIDSGELVFSEPFRARQPGRTLLSGPASVRAPRDGVGGRFIAEGPVVATGPAPGGALWQLSSSALDVSADPEGSLREVDTGVPTTIGARSAPGASTRGEGRVAASRWTLRPGPEPGSLVARASPGFALEWLPEGQPEGWKARGASLDLSQDAAGELVRVVGAGGVTILGPEAVRGEGERVAWSAGVPDELVLVGQGARVRKEGDLVEAPRIVFRRAAREIRGEGGAITEVRGVGGSDDALFGGDEPVRVRSARVVVPVEEGPLVFEGPVSAWQGETTLRAEGMRFLRDERVLVAEGAVTGRFVVARGKPERRTVRTSARRLVYEGQARRALLEGDALFRDGNAEVRARSIDVVIGEQGGIETLTAEGDVVLTQEGDRAEADRLVWENGDEGTIELIGSERLARLVSERQEREILSALIRYYPEDGRFETEGGEGRTVIVGPRGEGAEEKEPR